MLRTNPRQSEANDGSHKYSAFQRMHLCCTGAAAKLQSFSRIKHVTGAFRFFLEPLDVSISVAYVVVAEAGRVMSFRFCFFVQLLILLVSLVLLMLLLMTFVRL